MENEIDKIKELGRDLSAIILQAEGSRENLAASWASVSVVVISVLARSPKELRDFYLATLLGHSEKYTTELQEKYDKTN